MTLNHSQTLIGIDQAAELLGMSAQEICRNVDTGAIPGYMIDQQLRFRSAELANV